MVNENLALIRIFLSRDYDQVRADVESAKHLSQYKATQDPEDLPGLGRHYCIECAKWFESDYNLVAHRKGKNHKRRSVIVAASSSARLELTRAFFG